VAEDTPSLLDEALRLSRKPGPVCGVAIAIAEHPRGKEVAVLVGACERREVQFTAASVALGNAGIHLKKDALSRHSRRQCGCEPRVAA
jgi:hypothetical protein